MSEKLVDQIARAVLYEGYILYPYRPSVKNTQRWTFGGIFPRDFSEASGGSDAYFMQTQCLVAGSAASRISITLRFLHLTDRVVEEAPRFERVQSLCVGNVEYQSWQEALEREIKFDDIVVNDVKSSEQTTNAVMLSYPEASGRRADESRCFGVARHDKQTPADSVINPGDLAGGVQHRAFSFPGGRNTELLLDGNRTAGRLVREQQPVSGTIEVSTASVAPELKKITIRVMNQTPIDNHSNRDQALMRSFASTHLVLTARDGQFLSLTDPPASAAQWVSACENVGCWPVLVGEARQTDTLLVSPIILPDYPHIAPESPGDLFDSGEIDEILTLRIMTLTDEEKRQAASVDDRVRKMLERTQSLAREQLMNLHGTVRGLKPATQEQQHV